jgi:hypothetical protein
MSHQFYFDLTLPSFPGSALHYSWAGPWMFSAVLCNQPSVFQAFRCLVSAPTTFKSRAWLTVAGVGEKEPRCRKTALWADKVRLLTPSPFGPNKVVLPRIGHRNGQAITVLLNPRAASLSIANVNRKKANAVCHAIHVSDCNPQHHVQKIVHGVILKLRCYSVVSAERRHRSTSPRKVRGWA